MHVWDYMVSFVIALTHQLEEDEKRWGNTWLKRMPEGQEVRIREHIQSYFDQWEQVKTPVPWLKIAGLAMIGWVRENKPELWEN